MSVPGRRREATLQLLGAVAVAMAGATACSRTSASRPSLTTAPVPVLAPDQAVVGGSATSVHIVGANAAPVALPVTITIPNRGRGELNIEGVVVGGRPDSTVAWDGGQPLPLAGTGAIILGPATMDADAGGITWHLDGMPRTLAPGRYTAESAVAVGSQGLAKPEDRATFSVAAGGNALLVSAGDARIHLPPHHLSLIGPGSVSLDGTIDLRTSTGTRTVHHVAFGPGPYQLALSPAAGGYTVSGLLQGPLTSSTGSG